MKSALTVVLFRLFTIGVFVDGKEASNVSVMEGDSVTLKSGVTDVQTGDDIEWRFKGIRIDKFVDGLQLDSQTGDLKISNIRTKHAGLYKVQISSSTSGSSEMEFNVKVASADEAKSVSVLVGDSVTLRPDPTYTQRVDVIRWRFGQQTSLVAEINRTAGIFNTYDGPDERFRDRLKLDHQTGSLTITNTRTTDAGLYEADISSTRSKHTIHYTQSFNVTVSDEVKSVSVLEGDSVTLRTGLTEIQRDDQILWKFEDNDETIAPLKTWRNIDMNNQTRDLTISNIQRNQSGHYKVEIITRRMILHRKYRITIGEMKTVSVKEGESVTLQINVTKIQSDDLIVWMFGNINLAEFNKTGKLFTTSDVPDRRFRLRLDLNHQTGSLTIMNINSTHAGDYDLKIISSRHFINRRITVNVSGSDLQSGSGPQSGSGVQSGSDLQSGSGLQSDSGVQSGSGPQSDSGVQSGSGLQSAVTGSGLSPGAVAGIVVAVFLLLAAAVAVAVLAGFVKYYRRTISDLERQMKENGVNLKKEKTDDSATELDDPLNREQQ